MDVNGVSSFEDVVSPSLHVNATSQRGTKVPA